MAGTERSGWSRCWPVYTAFPVGILLSGREEITPAFIGAAVLFLPKLMEDSTKVDADAAIEATAQQIAGILSGAGV